MTRRKNLPGLVAAAVIHIQGVTFGPDQAFSLAARQQFGQRIQGAGQGLLLIVAGDNQSQQRDRAGRHFRLLHGKTAMRGARPEQTTLNMLNALPTQERAARRSLLPQACQRQRQTLAEHSG